MFSLCIVAILPQVVRESSPSTTVTRHEVVHELQSHAKTYNKLTLADDWGRVGGRERERERERGEKGVGTILYRFPKMRTNVLSSVLKMLI
jgi:hypothetical protein